MEILPSQKIFVIATCGGSDGVVRIDLKKILQPKTDHPIQTFMVRMPPNHIVGFDPFPDDVMQGLLNGAREAAVKIAEDIKTDAPPEVIEEPDREELFNMSRTFNRGMGVDRESREGGFYTSDACIQWCPNEAICHPNVPKERKHYRNPDITLEDMLSSKFPAE